ncbi:MAG TPA: hypothetical protein VGC32_10840 [Solirubrobacterales bacterium]
MISLLVFPVGTGLAAKGKTRYSVYASCANGKPFKAARHCHYDGSTYFRATTVFHSHAGKHPVKACFRLYGSKPLGGGHTCFKLGPITYKAYPFKITGIRQAFAVKFTWFVNDHGSGFHQVGSAFLKVRP